MKVFEEVDIRYREGDNLEAHGRVCCLWNKTENNFQALRAGQKVSAARNRATPG